MAAPISDALELFRLAISRCTGSSRSLNNRGVRALGRQSGDLGLTGGAFRTAVARDGAVAAVVDSCCLPMLLSCKRMAENSSPDPLMLSNVSSGFAALLQQPINNAARGAIEPIVSPHTMYNNCMYLFYSRIRTGPDTPYTGVEELQGCGLSPYARSVRL